MNKIWASIKRNPVINGIILTIVAQAIVEAMEDGHYDLRTIATYAFQLSLAYIIREFTVPYKDYKELEDTVSEAIVEDNIRRFQK